MAYGATMKKLNPCGDEEILALLRRHCPEARRILDAGCGRGDRLRALGAALPNAALYGLDLEENTVCPGAEIRRGDLCAPPWDAGTFDLVLCECTLSLTDNPAAALGALARLLYPGGVLLLGDLCAAGDGAPPVLAGCGGLRRLLFRGWVEDTARAAGLRTVEYIDCREALLAMAAEMVMDGSFCDCVGPEGTAALKAHRGGYGLWLLRKERV